jgi:carboxyl-terminal processing protease
MNKNNYFRPILTLAIVLLALYVGIRLGKMSAIPKGFNFSAGRQNNLSVILDYVSKYYVDPIAVDSLTETMIPDILKELDPHSVYIPASELKSSNEHIEGNFDGIGVTFNILNDTVIVMNVIADGPSSKAGVNPGDRIIVVDDSIIAGKKIPQNKIMTLLKGTSGSKVQIKVLRRDVDELIPIEITRGKVFMKSITVAYMITSNTGYVNMSVFAKNTHSEFVEAVKKLHSEGMTNLILDLRNNLGGLLDQAIDITSELFPDKELIVYTEGQAFSRKNEYSKGNGICGNDSLIILINEQSASASEILAGAVQDNDRGVIIGRRSFGKGLVQHMIELPDHAGLRLTIARYYTPSGRSIQRPYKHGSMGVADYYDEFQRRGENGEFMSADSIKQTDSTEYYTSTGRVVYGGGGITPDVFVPYEPDNKYVQQLGNSRVTLNYALTFGDKHRNELNAIENFSQLDAFFEKNNPYLKFGEYVKNKGFIGSAEDIKNSKELLEMYLKSYVSLITPLSDLGAAFFENKFDKTVQKALEIIKTKTVETDV